MFRQWTNWRASLLGVIALSLPGLVFWMNRTLTKNSSAPDGLFSRFDRDGNGVARLSEVPEDYAKQFEFLLDRAGLTQYGAMTHAQFDRAIRGGSSFQDAGNETAPIPETPTQTRVESTTKADSNSNEQTDGQTHKRAASASAVTPAPPTLGLADQERGQSVSTDANNAAAESSTPPTMKLEEGDDVPQVVSFSRRRLFEWLDTNHDARLSETEIPGSLSRVLLRSDWDRDGHLRLDEFSQGIELASRIVEPQLLESNDRATRSGGLVSRPAPGEQTPLYVRQTPEHSAAAELPGWFRERDRNRDNQVAQHEWPAGELDTFHRFDANHDGFISRPEAIAENTTSPRSVISSTHTSKLPAHP